MNVPIQRTLSPRRRISTANGCASAPVVTGSTKRSSPSTTRLSWSSRVSFVADQSPRSRSRSSTSQSTAASGPE
jgi:hypothetical protein